MFSITGINCVAESIDGWSCSEVQTCNAIIPQSRTLLNGTYNCPWLNGGGTIHCCRTWWATTDNILYNDVTSAVLNEFTWGPEVDTDQHIIIQMDKPPLLALLELGTIIGQCHRYYGLWATTLLGRWYLQENEQPCLEGSTFILSKGQSIMIFWKIWKIELALIPMAHFLHCSLLTWGGGGI